MVIFVTITLNETGYFSFLTSSERFDDYEPQPRFAPEDSVSWKHDKFNDSNQNQSRNNYQASSQGNKKRKRKEIYLLIIRRF